jgi:hypothetical protein
MKDIKNENGYLLYTITESEITLDNIKVYKQRIGTGKKMIEELKEIAIEIQLPIGLYSYPQDNTIQQEDLNDFYRSCGFELDVDDCDNRLFIWGV